MKLPKKLREMIEQLPNSEKPLIHNNHKPLTTRRDFLGSGFLAGSAMVALPSVGTMLGAARAYGQEGCSQIQDVAGSPLPVFTLDLGGGANLVGGEFIVGTDSQTNYNFPGGLESAYANIGLNPGQLPTDAGMVRTINGKPDGCLVHSQSDIVGGMELELTAEEMSWIDAAVIPHESGDDTRTNPLNFNYPLAKAGGIGQLAAFVGTGQSNGLGRSAGDPEFMAPFAKARIQGNNDVRGLVSPGRLSELLGDEGVEKAFRTFNSLTSQQLARLNRQDVDQQVRTIVECSGSQALSNLTKYTIETVDPQQDPLIQQVVDQVPGPERAALAELYANVDLNNGQKETLGGIGKLIFDGFAGSGLFEIGGYDYHGNPRSTQAERNARAGRALGKMFKMAFLKNKPLMAVIISDGSVGFRNDTPDDSALGRGRRSPTNDKGENGSCIVIVGRPGGVTPRGPGLHQVNDWMQGGASRDKAVGNKVLNLDGSNLAKILVAQWMMMVGRPIADIQEVLNDTEIDPAAYATWGQIV